MKRIVIIGRCPLEKERSIEFISSFNLEEYSGFEMNVFDTPRTGGFDSIDIIDDVFIHRYAYDISAEDDEVLLIRKIVRDIVALGPVKCVLLKNSTQLSKKIFCAVKSFGINSSIQ